MNFLDNLNPMQRQATLTTEGPLLLLAGAGSGKTTALTSRIAHLISKGVSPFNILAITFTNKAAREMKLRLDFMLSGSNDIWVSTFHSTCVRILRREIDKLGFDRKFTIYDTDDTQKLIKQILKELNINEKLFPVKTVLNKISEQKNNLVTPEEYARSVQGDFRLFRIAELYDIYQKKLKASNALDFDDLLFKTTELFLKNPDVLEQYQNRFKYIHVDEYQDTNMAQYRLVYLLSQKYKNLCVVGDDDQSIYGWRGADIRNILDFEKDFPGAKVLKLEQNYRSTKTILSAANSVIKNNKNRKPKELWTQNATGSKINYYKAASDIEEAIFVSSTIRKKKKEGLDYNNFAVLYRINSQSRLIEDQLVRLDIPYRIFGGIRFYERKEVKDILAYLKVIFNPLDDISLKRIINVPRRGIGDDTITRLEAYAADMELPFIRALNDAEDVFPNAARLSKIENFKNLLDELTEISLKEPVTKLIEVLLEKTGYNDDLMTNKDQDEAMERVANITELSAKAAEFEKNTDNPSLEAFIQEVALVADIDNYTENQNAVVLMTMHSAKGLEFKEVFAVGFEEGIFPGSRAAVSSNENDMEEERRVCYVTITRAKENLYISSAVQRQMFNETVYNSPSRFIKEIPSTLINELGATASKSTIKMDTHKSKPITFDYQKNSHVMPTPKSGPLSYTEGDFVKQKKYGIGKVLAINPAGATHEVTIEFTEYGTKKFMASLSNIEKI